MLAFLPALILMLVKGPAHCERVACEGRLPAALAVLQHRIEAARPARIASGVSADQALLSSLMRLGSSPDLRQSDVARVFLHLLQLAAPAPIALPTDSERRPPSFAVHPFAARGRAQLGFFACGRTRDGPASA